MNGIRNHRQLVGVTAALIVALSLIGCGSGGTDGESGSKLTTSGGGGNNNSPLTIAKITPDKGDSGMTIKIEGSGLDPDEIKDVRFGSVKALVIKTFEDGSRLDVRAPVQPQSEVMVQPVRVELVDGQSDTFFPGFIYENNTNCTAPGLSPEITLINTINLVTDTEFLIQGLNFETTGVIVNVAGLVADVVSSSPTDITAEVPSGLANQCSTFPCEVQVDVANATGCQDSDQTTVVNEGFPIYKAFNQTPYSDGQHFGRDLVSAKESVDADNIKDFAVLSNRDLTLQSGDPAATTYLQKSPKFPYPYEAGVADKCVALDGFANSYLENVGDINSDGLNDYAVFQYHYTYSGNGMEYDTRLCVYSGQNLSVGPFAKLYKSQNIAHGLALKRAGGYLMLGRDFRVDTAINKGTVHLCEVGDFTGNDPCNSPDAELIPSGAAHDFGRVLAYLGDPDGDGKDEYAVGASSEGVGGAVYIFDEADKSLTTGDIPELKKILAGSGTTKLGHTLEVFGDLLLIGATSKVIAYNIDDLINPAITPSPVFELTGYQTGDTATPINPFQTPYMQITALNDVNGDGVNDFAIGDFNFNTFESTGIVGYGRAAVFSGDFDLGETPQELFAHDSDGPCAGLSQRCEYLGFAIAPGGDVNGDGFHEVIFGAPTSNTGMDSNVYMHSMWSGQVIYPYFP